MFEATPGIELSKALQQAVGDIFQVESIMLDPHRAGVVRLYGYFLVDTAEAYQVAQRRLDTLGYTPLFRTEEDRHSIEAIPGKLPTERPRLAIAVTLFVLTVLSTVYTGMNWSLETDRPLWQNLLSGLPFALTLMSILLAHEMGHYVVGRRLGVPITLPYFIPLPYLNPILGTMGAFIQMKAPPQNRRHLLAVGVAGPLAGLVVCIPLLIFGLLLSEVEPLPTIVPEGQVLIMEGNSILYVLLKFVLFGQFLPSGGLDVTIHPIALAAWAGLLVTGMNLVPAGTLDGGHVAYALLGERARHLTWAVIGALVLLGFLWSGWFLWAALIALLGRRHAVPLDDITRLEPKHIALAVFVLLIFILVFIPIPLRIIQ